MRYNVQLEARKVLEAGILDNPLHSNFPKDIRDYAKFITFEGASAPSIPINWRFAESVSSLKALEGCFLNALLVRKYKESPKQITINTDHASLFFMSTILNDVVDKDGNIENKSLSPPQRVAGLFPKPPGSGANPGGNSATNIFKTLDGRFYHIHGSLDPTLTLAALNLDESADVSKVANAVSQINSDDLDRLMNDKHRQAGTIAWTVDEFANSEQGKAIAGTGLYSVDHVPNAKQAPGWWAPSSLTSSKRPLAGLKVVDLTRIIAGPAITRGLAELGASVMRVTAPHLPDLLTTHADLMWGKWQCSLDLRQESDREKLKALILDADVVVDGYRPGVFTKYGFGREQILEMCKDRKNGILHIRENCYGWKGPWAHRSGWQQISDANCGVSIEFGRAMGNDEAVTPVFPNSDYCTGLAGLCATMDALIKKSEIGGSFAIDISLNYYSQWLINSCGMYPVDVWESLWSKYDRPVFRHTDNMMTTIPAMVGMLAKKSGSILFKPDFFEVRYIENVDKHLKAVKPILTLDGVDLGYTVGPRANGKDKAIWPQDLTVDVVA